MPLTKEQCLAAGGHTQPTHTGFCARCGTELGNPTPGTWYTAPDAIQAHLKE